MWIEFENESDKFICRLYRSVINKSNYILQFYVNDYNRVKIRNAEIKDIFNDLQERTNMKISDYFEELEEELDN
jgi:hypothetical protein